MNKWKRYPIGGEIRPEAWRKVFLAEASEEHIQDFVECVEATLASWLMDSGLFNEPPSAELRSAASRQTQRLGYEFFVAAAEFPVRADGQLEVIVEVINRGVAPFYYDWPVEFALLDRNGALQCKSLGGGRLLGLLPAKNSRSWRQSIDTQQLATGAYYVLMRIPNPMKSGLCVRFANVSQDQHLADWLTLGRVAIKN